MEIDLNALCEQKPQHGEVHGSGPSLGKDPLCTSDIEHRRWCIHPGFKTHGWSQPKSETESTRELSFVDLDQDFNW